MKVKEATITANISWSPRYINPIYIACGTSTQQIDSSGNPSVLQIHSNHSHVMVNGAKQFWISCPNMLYTLNASDGSLDMKLAATKEVSYKFNKILWHGKEDGAFGNVSGIIAGGCDNGSIYIYCADKILNKEESILMTSMENKHAGPVYTLDFNHHQQNLLATGSTNCEIIIWDINNPSLPMTPGAKPKLAADVNAVSWNKQVEHIMASTYAGRCVVYDLRKSSSIIQISESISRIKAHSIQWHPSVATQLILACDDDNSPYGQVWDLRFAAAPFKLLEGHQQGIMATSWCSADPDLFLTSAKDNRIYVWNPNSSHKSAEIVGEFPLYNLWSFDISWCERDPSLVATASVDGTVSVYSIMGAGSLPLQNNKFSAIADSFPGMEVPAEVPQAAQPSSIYLKQPPKWLFKQCGARFGFGGRLVSWNAASHSISLSQVVTEPNLISQSIKLEQALSSQADLISFCSSKVETSDGIQKTLWDFIKATFDPSVRKTYIELLGLKFNQESVEVCNEDDSLSPENLAKKMSNLGSDSQDGKPNELEPTKPLNGIAPETQDVGVVSNIECTPPEHIPLAASDDVHGRIRHALLIGDFESVIQLCLKEKKTSLALILAAYAGNELFTKVRDNVLKDELHMGLSPLVKAVVHKDLSSLVSLCSLSEWKESLVGVFTYATDEELPLLANTLGNRLEAEGSPESFQSAVLCFLCAGNLDKFVSCLTKAKPILSDGTPKSLQELVEIIVVLERALSSIGKNVGLSNGSSASFHLLNYASLLASQGALSTAVSYINNSTQGDMADLRDRLYSALGYPTGSTLNARNRSISTSSQHSLKRSSQASQFAASVQAPPSTYGSKQTSFFNPSLSPQQPTSTPTLVAGNPSSQSQYPPPSLTPALPMSALHPKPGGFHKHSAPNRYIHEATMTSTQRNVLTPPSKPPTQFMHPNGELVGRGVLTPSDTISSPLRSEIDPEPVENVITPAAFNPSIPRGWNDPPLLSAFRKPKHQQKSVSDVSAASELISPNVMVPEPQKLPSQLPVKPEEVNLKNAHYQTLSGNAPSLPEKEPLPTEYQAIQDVFNRLKEKGLHASINPTAKQRIDDVTLKIDILYDKLRLGQIGNNTVEGLHQIVSAVKSGDYHRALQLHSATISGGNFSEMSQFMPAIKMLLTTCMQYQIFYS